MSFNIAVDGDFLNTGVFTPASVSSSSHVKINGKSVSLVGNFVTTHSRTFPSETHSGASILSLNQNFVKINGINVIVDEDPATCDVTHTITATGFVLIHT